MLLDEGAEVNSRDRGGKTPLLLAAGKGHDTTVNILLDKGANADSQEKDDKTPLSWAAWNGHDTSSYLGLVDVTRDHFL